MDRLRPLVDRVRAHGREASVVAIGHAFSLAGNFAGLKLLTRWLRPESYGELALAMTAAGAIFSLGYSPLAGAMLRYHSVHEEQGALPMHVALFRRAHGQLIALTLLVAGGAALASGLWTQPKWGLLIGGGALYAMGNGAAVLFTTYSTANRVRTPVALYQWLDSWCRPLFAAAAMLLWGKTALCALAGYVAAGAVNAAVQRAISRRTPALLAAQRGGEARVPEGPRREVLRYLAPLAFTALFTSVASYGDRWTLQGLLGPADLGIYAALCQVGLVPSSLASSMISAFILPICFTRAGDLSRPAQLDAALRVLRLGVWGCLGLTVPAVAVALAAGRPILRLLTSGDYAAQAGLLWVVVLAGFVLAAGRTALLSVEILKRTGHQTAPWIANAATTVLFSLLLGARWGVPGVIYALLISNLCGALVCFGVSARLAGQVRRELASAG